MSFHGNSYQNENLHHLYAIFDKETGQVDKYGITDDAIDEDGLSGRIREHWTCSTESPVGIDFMLKF